MVHLECPHEVVDLEHSPAHVNGTINLKHEIKNETEYVQNV